LNLDMVGRLRADKEGEKEFLLVEGANTGKDYKDLVDELNKKYDLQLRYGRGVPGNSDHFSFYQKNIPVIFFWTGTHADYHRPSDTADKINVPGMRKIVDLAEEVATNFTTREKRPEFVRITNSPRQPGSGGGTGPTIGIRPKYGDDGEGVLLDGVSEGGLAEKAGLKAGDRIIEVAGKPVKSLEGYVEVMRTLKAEGTLELTILRDGKKQTVTIKF
jgi:C-terminal processing protease CtpA/Prc